MKTLGVWFLNFVLGIVGTAILVTKLTGQGEGISAGSGGASVGIRLDLTGIVIWVVAVLVYFFGAKKLWGKTVGGLIVDMLKGKKK